MEVSAVDSSRYRASLERLNHITDCIMQTWSGRASEIIVSPDSILTEKVIQNNTSQYIFDLWDKTLQNQSPPRPLVKGVKDNDLFFAMQVRLLIDSRTVGNSNVKVQTWPSPQAFFGSGATPDHLWSIYNAKWSLQVDRVVYIQSELTRRFAKTPPFYTSTQAGIVPGTGITGFAEPINQIIGDTYIDLDPYPIISGRLDNKLTLDVSLFASWNGAANTSLYATTENVISFEFHGFTVKNGSQWMPFFNGQLDVDDPEAVKNYTPGTNV